MFWTLIVPDLFDVYDLSPATDHWQHAAMKTFTSLITILFATVDRDFLIRAESRHITGDCHSVRLRPNQQVRRASLILRR